MVPPPMTAAYALNITLTSTTDTIITAFKVNQMVTFVAIFTEEEAPLSPISNKRSQDEGQYSPGKKVLLNRLIFLRMMIYGRQTLSCGCLPFFLIDFPTLLRKFLWWCQRRTFLTFKTSLRWKMVLISEITCNMYQNFSLFSLVADGQGDIMVVGNPYKKRETWKGKCEAMKHRCLAFQK